MDVDIGIDARLEIGRIPDRDVWVLTFSCKGGPSASIFLTEEDYLRLLQAMERAYRSQAVEKAIKNPDQLGYYLERFRLARGMDKEGLAMWLECPVDRLSLLYLAPVTGPLAGTARGLAREDRLRQILNDVR